VRDGYGCVEALRQVCRDIRQPTVIGHGFGASARRGARLGLSAVAREAFEHYWGLGYGRGRFGGRRVNPWLSLTTSPVGVGAADATCPV
jgi:hypothetical protein